MSKKKKDLYQPKKMHVFYEKVQSNLEKVSYVLKERLNN